MLFEYKFFYFLFQLIYLIQIDVFDNDVRVIIGFFVGAFMLGTENCGIHLQGLITADFDYVAIEQLFEFFVFDNIELEI